MNAPAYWLVLFNVVWDFVSVLAIATNLHYISKYHTDYIWTSDSDKTNYAARTLMAWWVFSLGLARLASVLNPSQYLLCGVVSYLLEGAFGMLGLITQTMRVWEGTAIMVLSFLFAGFMLV